VGLHGSLGVWLAANWYAALLAGYDWVADEVEVRVGPNTLRLDLSGYSLAIEAGRRF
jgi:hypothetical protein